jgi:hypothetical protein
MIINKPIIELIPATHRDLFIVEFKFEYDTDLISIIRKIEGINSIMGLLMIIL